MHVKLRGNCLLAQLLREKKRIDLKINGLPCYGQLVCSTAHQLLSGQAWQVPGHMLHGPHSVLHGPACYTVLPFLHHIMCPLSIVPLQCPPPHCMSSPLPPTMPYKCRVPNPTPATGSLSPWVTQGQGQAAEAGVRLRDSNGSSRRVVEGAASGAGVQGLQVNPWGLEAVH